nr:glycosyltransferase family 2 protein [Lachnospiraceae bacterium]
MISIVMPVHNTGSILADSIGSILDQKYKDWELILVDDGSDDSETISLLAYFRQLDQRIRCIRSDVNVGAAGSRNKGIDLASGEYLICLDSDDIFYSDMLSEMVRSIEVCDVELCICDFDSFDDQTGEIWESGHLVHTPGITDRPFHLSELGERGLLYWWMSPWEMLCRRSFIERNHIRFQDLPCCNDIFFGAMCAQKAKKIAYAKNGQPLMKYRTGRRNSISSNRHPAYAFQAVKAVADRIEDKMSVEYRQLMVFLCECSMMLFFAYGKEDDKEYYDFLRSFISTNIASWNIREEDSKRRMLYFIRHDHGSKWFKKIA